MGRDHGDWVGADVGAAGVEAIIRDRITGDDHFLERQPHRNQKLSPSTRVVPRLMLNILATDQRQRGGRGGYPLIGGLRLDFPPHEDAKRSSQRRIQ